MAPHGRLDHLRVGPSIRMLLSRDDDDSEYTWLASANAIPQNWTGAIYDSGEKVQM
jgi:hypothetical protein